MRLLVIEDEPKLAEYLRRGLTQSGYVVDVASVEFRKPREWMKTWGGGIFSCFGATCQEKSNATDLDHNPPTHRRWATSGN